MRQVSRHVVLITLLLLAGRELQGAPPGSRLDSVLAQDPLLADPDRLESLIAQQEKAAGRVGASPAERGRLLRDLGALQWLLSEALRGTPGGGSDEGRAAQASLEEAVRLLARAPSGPDLLDAKRRLAEVLAFSWCPDPDGPDSCENQERKAVALAQEALSLARQTGQPALIALGLRSAARVHAARKELQKAGVLLDEALAIEPAQAGTWSTGRIESLIERASLDLRSENAVALIYEAIDGAAALDLPGDSRVVGDLAREFFYFSHPNQPLPRIPGYEAQALARMAEGADRATAYVLLKRSWTILDDPETAFELATLLVERNQLAEAERVVARGLQLSSLPVGKKRWGLLTLKARLLQLRDKSSEAKKLLRETLQEIAATPWGRPAFIPPYWIQRATAAVVEIDAARCDQKELRSSLRELLAAERNLIAAAMQEMSEVSLRSVFVELEAEGRVFAPVVRCGLQDPETLQASIERILFRREIWQYRSLLMEAGRRRKPQTARDLAGLRKMRAQLRLRQDDRALAAELKTISVPDNLTPPPDATPGTIAVVQTEFVIDHFEQGLAELLEPRAFEARISGLWSRLTGALGPEEALVGYLPVRTGDKESRWIALVVDGRARITWADLGEEAGITSRLGGTWARLTLKAEDTQEFLRRSGMDLFDPIESSLRGKSRIFLLASGPVRFVPWSALLDAQGRFLGERFVTTWLQVVADALPDPRASFRDEAVLLAPEYEKVSERSRAVPLSSRLIQADFPPLPGASGELTALEGVLRSQGARFRPVSGRKATEEALRALAGPRLLHIAAHGFRVPEGTPLIGGDGQAASNRVLYWPTVLQGFLEPGFLRVGVALSGANRGGTLREDDNLLTASEAADLDLQGTALVVLSGCETAYPALQDLGGTYDLSLGFRMAGASSVVGSLWRVDDRATMILMTELYRFLVAGETVAEALWKAKEKLRRSSEFSHPAFWAGFEALGTGGPVWDRETY